jgi:hypothetical protein
MLIEIAWNQADYPISVVDFFKEEGTYPVVQTLKVEN